MTTQGAAVERQRAVAQAESNLFVRACPGAGKTRTVVDRYVRIAASAAPPPVAVISFTNRAADEVRSRCSSIGRPDLVGYPNFVGTFDRFIATYIVRPFGRIGGPIRIVDSWQSLDVIVAGSGGPPVSLDHFEIQPNGLLRFDRRDGDPQLEGADLGRREYSAAQRLAELRTEGYLTCEDARRYALELIEENPKLVPMIRGRFAELIVDEAQDCNPLELDLLGRLRDSGMRVAVICDPDQSIFEWRDADPAHLDAFVAETPTIILDGNWRSSPAVCALGASLKAGPADHPVGRYESHDEPIHLIRYTGFPSPSVASQFLVLLEHADIAAADTAILAHALGPAARVAGASTGSAGGNAGVLLRSSENLLSGAADARSRQLEFDRLQRLVLRFLHSNPAGHSTERTCELASIDSAWLRSATLNLAHRVSELSFATPCDEWIAAVRLLLQSLAAGAPSGSKPPGTFLRAPSQSSDKTIGQALKISTTKTAMSYSTIHSAKGTESPAVLVVIPPDRAPTNRSSALVSAWEDGHYIEAVRVLYVGVTRAERLCALAVPEALHGRVAAVLSGRDVPYVVHPTS